MEGQSRNHVLRVDLSAGSVERERVPDDWRRQYLGGKGLGARYLYEELQPGVDPLGPRNVLAIMIGPLTGYLPGEQRYAAITRSPLTGTFLDSYSGGHFPGALAGALPGHLGVIVEGVADEPVSIVLEDDTAHIEPADTWGHDAVDTSDAFDGSAACIGPAGENQVAYATIATDRAEHHAGRGGAGAVMGSKNLKAIVARGTEPDLPPELAALHERATEAFTADDTGRWHRAGETVETIDFAAETDVLSARGWQERGFDGADNIGIEAVQDRTRERERPDEIPGGFRIETGVGDSVPRGATAMTLGAGLDIDEFDAVAELGERCNRLGLDLISGGNAVALAIRAADAGLVDRDIAFGDPDTARSLLEEIAHRDTPLGDALAEGVRRAASHLDATQLIPTVKSMALPAYDPRGADSMALAYATSDRGACHRRARPVERSVFEDDWSPETVASAVIEAQDVRSVRWSLVADDHVGEVIDVATWLDAARVPHDDLDATGERIWTLVRLFNVREGFARADDELPPVFDESDAISRDRFEAMLDAYYDERGWSDDGVPTRATLDRLDLLETVDDHTPLPEATSDATDSDELEDTTDD